MRGRLFLPICSFSVRISQGFFFSIPTVELSNKKANKAPRNPTKVTTHAGTQTWAFGHSQLIGAKFPPAQREEHGYIFWWNNRTFLLFPSLAHLLGASKIQFLKLRFSSSFPGRNWNFSVKVAHPVPDFSTKFTSWSQTLKQQRANTNHPALASWLVIKSSPWLFSLGKQRRLFRVRINLCQRGDVIRDYHIIYFSSLAHHHSLGAAGISCPVIKCHLVHSSREVGFRCGMGRYPPVYPLFLTRRAGGLSSLQERTGTFQAIRKVV